MGNLSSAPGESLPQQKKTPDEKRHERELKVANQTNESIVDLMRRLGVHEPGKPSEKPLWSSREKIWKAAFADIKRTNKGVKETYEGLADQNVALLEYIRDRIKSGENFDAKTLEFKAYARKEKAVEDAERDRRRVMDEVGPPNPYLKPEGKSPEKAREVKAVPKSFENTPDVLKEIEATINRFHDDNRNRPYDTSRSGSDGSTLGSYLSKGHATVLDNITGKLLKVNQDPAKAEKVRDSFGREKILSGKPAICTDIIMEYLNKAGVRAPEANRSVYVFEGYAKRHPENYSVFSQGLKFPGYGKELKFDIPAQTGDIMTITRANGDRHISIVGKVINGVPAEMVDSSAINQGVGKRPFLAIDKNDTVTDFNGHVRTRAIVGPGVVVINIIRPHYKLPLRDLTKAKGRGGKDASKS